MILQHSDSLDGAAVETGGYGRRFQWGNYLDTSNAMVQGSFFQPTKYSTCMTTEEGPVDTRFKYCDSTWVCSPSQNIQDLHIANVKKDYYRDTYRSTTLTKLFP